MRRTLQQAVIIVLASAALGLAVNAVSPRGLPFITPPKAPLKIEETVSLDEAKKLWSAGATFFLDARAPADYEAGHIANAFNLPVEEFDQHYPQVAAMLGPDMPIVVYCDGVDCELSHRLAAMLRQRNYKTVRILVNGWTTWHNAGLPTTTGANP